MHESAAMSGASPAAHTRRPPVVMIVDDHEWSARAFESVLSPLGYSVLRCRHAQQTLEHIETITPDALLIKADLPGLPASELCRALRAHPRIGVTTPVFVTSAAPIRREQRLEILRAGAWDLFSVPIDTEELITRLSTYVASKIENDRARAGSLVDFQSGLYSLQGLLRRVRELGLDAHRHRGPIGCVAIGTEPDATEPGANEMQDKLSWIGERLVRFMSAVGRGSDSIGRLSETEFVVVAARTTSDGVLRMAHRLHEAALAFQTEDGGTPLRIRLGCYAVDDFHQAVIEPVEVLVRATMALRQAQRDAEAAPIRFFGPAMSAN